MLYYRKFYLNLLCIYLFIVCVKRKCKSIAEFIFFSLFLFPEEGEYFLKVLIPSYAAGSIIGKGGQTIVQLQKETGATIKLSKSKDFYPGKSSNSRKLWREPSSTSSCLLHHHPDIKQHTFQSTWIML